MEIKKTRLKQINVISNDDVYDIKVRNNHNFFANGLLIHNCGEILLCLNDSCRLLLLNLFSYIVNPFTPDAYFDRDLFAKHVQIAERLMDDIVDLEIEKIDQIIAKVEADPEPDYIKLVELKLWYDIKEKAINGRRTGLGLTGLGDMIAANNMVYGTSEATVFAENVMKIIALNTYHSSITLAEERGAFPIFSFEKEKNNPFLQRLYDADPSLEKRTKKSGRRAISANTISPAGSMSIMTQTTSGIESVFDLRYKRRRKINPNDKNTKSVFIDASGDHWEEYDVLHPAFALWLESNGYNVSEVSILPFVEFNAVVAKSPYYHARANEIDWREKVKMQGAMQKWIDHSISNTTNLPKSATEQDISDLYMLAWETGCKGVTVYREGSRTGVLISEDAEQPVKVADEETHAIPRPKTINCDVVRFMNNSEKWIAFLGVVDGYPYEIFTGLSEEFPIPAFVENGKIRRVKDNGHGSRYDFMYVDKGGFEQTILGLNRVFKPEFWTYAKLISGLLRNRMHLVSLIRTIQSLNITDNNINTWFNGVVRILKRYVKDGVKAGDCPICGVELQFSDGCIICPSCGYSHCGS